MLLRNFCNVNALVNACSKEKGEEKKDLNYRKEEKKKNTCESLKHN